MLRKILFLTLSALACMTGGAAEIVVPRLSPQPLGPSDAKLSLNGEWQFTTALGEIRHLCELNPGIQEIILVLKDQNGKRPLRLPFRVEISPELTKPLAALLGEQCVKVK